MGKSKIKASVKKIEIVNKVSGESWDQSIRIILGDIELNDDNLIELKKFRPNEAVNVCFESQQMSLLEFTQEQGANYSEDKINSNEDLSVDKEEDLRREDICFLEDYEEPNPEDIVKEFVL
ncbi:MAG: hypothetical protein KGZ94_07710 [Clostridia bacterium]|nr:hypothetical protein [Clostridia bacterium]